MSFRTATNRSDHHVVPIAPRALRDFIPAAVRHPLAASATAWLALRASLADEASKLVAAGPTSTGVGYWGEGIVVPVRKTLSW